jgi:hypothetical protein
MNTKIIRVLKNNKFKFIQEEVQDKNSKLDRIADK